LTVSVAHLQTEHQAGPDGSNRQNDDEVNHFWLIEPAADPKDPWWQGRPIWQLAVRAMSAAEARVRAEHWAQNGTPARLRVGNESPSKNAGFGDVRLYHVRPLPQAEASEWLTDDSVVVLAGPHRPEGGD
jgi:hypothetical protein